jgi:hypothetical protein
MNINWNPLLSMSYFTSDSNASNEESETDSSPVSPIDREMYMQFLTSNLNINTNTNQTPSYSTPTPISPYPSTPPNSPCTHEEWIQVPWTEQQENSIPAFIQSMAVYPIASVFATCFQEELTSIFNDWFDENGDLLDDAESKELNLLLERKQMLETSIEYLSRVVPIGR